MFEREGYRYTYRWYTHIHYVSLLNRVLGSRLNAAPFVALDIGSSYGIFSYLLKSEYPRSPCVLVDFPEQLLLAYYFLGKSLPSARIAGVRELSGLTEITQKDIEQYDFVLVPCPWYRRIQPGSIDLITNFMSLAEMSREWFDYYVHSPVFTGAKYFYTENRFQSAPTYESDLTILDYPVWDPGKRLHFSICPVATHMNRSKWFFFYQKDLFPSQVFEYIGLTF